jgi:hypothetical protein
MRALRRLQLQLQGSQRGPELVRCIGDEVLLGLEGAANTGKQCH